MPAATAEPEVDQQEAAALQEARTACLTLADQLRDMRTKSVEQRSDNWSAELRRVIDELDAVDREYTARQALASERRVGPHAATLPTGGAELRSAGEVFSNHEVVVAARNRGKEGLFARLKDDAIEVPLSSLILGRAMPSYRDQVNREVRTLLDSATTGAVSAGLFVPTPSPFLNAASIDRRRLFVEDVMASGTTDAALIRYIRELNPRVTEEGITSVAEGATKPELEMTFVEADAPVRKTAGWIPITEELLEDAPALESYINGRLMYMSDLRTEQQILNGSGAGSDLLGILNESGVQAQGAVGGASPDAATALALSIARIEDVDGYPDAVAMYPSDFWQMLTRRTTNAGVYDSMFNGAVVDQVWGLRVIRTRAMPQGTALVGDWGRGGQVFNRKAASIRVADQHADYFVKNLRVILVERRLAVAWYRPDWFCTVATGLSALA
jgi:HK97 family phage major capsid protein